MQVTPQDLEDAEEMRHLEMRHLESRSALIYGIAATVLALTYIPSQAIQFRSCQWSTSAFWLCVMHKKLEGTKNLRSTSRRV